MNGLAPALLLFIASAALVIASGAYLARYGDVLAARLGWGRVWGRHHPGVGSYVPPELLTNITVATRDQPDLAGGDILGSNMVNMLVLASVALLFGGRRFSPGRAGAEVAGPGRLIPHGPCHRPHRLSHWPGRGLRRTVFSPHPGDLSRGDAPGLRGPSNESARRGRGRRTAQPSQGVDAVRPGIPGCHSRCAVACLQRRGDRRDHRPRHQLPRRHRHSPWSPACPRCSTKRYGHPPGASDLAFGNLYGSCAFNILILALADPFYREGGPGGGPWDGSTLPRA